ncbi:amidohydrolase family protein [Paenibacillus whitsoniae]|nr:amidohydrolase family protein [Paenibacillus whitsoniae]
MYVDSHVHFWQPARGDYGWLKPDHPLLYQDYLPVQLLPEMTVHGVEAVIAVQAAPTAAEAAFLLELAQTAPAIAGVSGGLDPLAERFDAELAQLQANTRFAGVRFGGSAFRAGRPPAEQRRLRAALASLQQVGLTLDLLVQPGDLAAVAGYLEEQPQLTAVVNHLGCPPVREQPSESWLTGMARLAELPRTAVKLSGMITMAGGYRPALLQPYVDRLLQLYGPDRLLFGSDWPIALQAGGYGDVIRLFEAVLGDELAEEEKGKIRAGNARRFYPIQR